MARAPWELAGFGLYDRACFGPLAIAAAAMTAVSSIASGLGQIQAGKAADVSAKFQAGQLEQQAGQERASSQRTAIEERRRSDIAISDATAAAAFSGGGATDPTVMNITGGLAKQGEYNALSALFEGEEKARGLRLGATAARMEGKQAKKQGMIGGVSTIIGGLGQAGMGYSKYNPKAGAA